MTAEFKHRNNRGRIFWQFGAKGKQPKFKGKIMIDNELKEVSGWKNEDHSIDLEFEPIAKAEAARSKAKKERRRKEREK